MSLLRALSLVILLCQGILAEQPLRWSLRSGPKADSDLIVQSTLRGDTADFRPCDPSAPLPAAAELGDSVYLYRTHLPVNAPIESHLSLGVVNHPLLVLFEGVPVHRWGSANPPYVTAKFRGEQILLHRSYKTGAPPELLLRIQPRGASYGLPAMRWGSYEQTAGFAHLQTILNLVLPAAACLACLLASILFLTLWFMLGRERSEWLWFALSSFGISASYTNVVWSIPGIDEGWAWVIGRMGMFLSSSASVLFLLSHAGLVRTERILRPFLIGIFGCLALWLLTHPSRILVEQCLHVGIGVLVLPAMLAGLLLVAWLSIRRGWTQDHILLAGFSFLGACTLHDILRFSQREVPFVWLFPIGFFGLDATMVVSLSLEFLKLWNQNKQRAVDLDHTEQALLRSQKDSESALRSRAQFLDRLTHEFRTPLQGLNSILDLVKASGNTDSASLLAATERQLRRHLAQVNNAVDLSDRSRGPLILRRQVFHPEYLEEGWRQHFALDDEPVSHAPVELAQAWQADTERIERLVLLVGALLQQGSGSSVVPECRVEHNLLVITLWRKVPNGEGARQTFESTIASDLPEAQIFHLLLEALKATVKTKSVGDSFELILRIPVEPAEFLPESIGQSIVPLVLLAEDDRVNGKLLSALLERAGCRVAWGQNGREAIDLAEKERPTLVLMDVMMPEMDGLEATKHLRRHPTLFDLTIIGVTAHAQPDEVLAAGMNGYLAKPVRSSQLRQLVERYCRTSLISR